MQEYSLTFDFRTKRYNDASAGLLAFAEQVGKMPTKLAKVAKTDLRDFLNEVAKALYARHSGVWPGGTGIDTMSKRSGRGIRSIIRSVKVTGNSLASLEGRIGGLGYLMVQEEGAVIKAKKAQFLTIPLKAALRSNGTPKFKSAREWRDTFIAKSKAGNLIIFQKQRTKIIPLYVLKKSVTIPRRLGLGKTLEKGLPLFVDVLIDSMLSELKNAAAS